MLSKPSYNEWKLRLHDEDYTKHCLIEMSINKRKVSEEVHTFAIQTSQEALQLV